MSHKNGTRPQKAKRSSYTSYYTVMIARGVGKVRSFRVSAVLLGCSCLLLALYLIASAFFINRYFHERRVNRMQAVLLEQVKGEVEDIKKALYAARQRLEFMEDQFSHPAGARGNTGISNRPGGALAKQERTGSKVDSRGNKAGHGKEILP